MMTEQQKQTNYNIGIRMAGVYVDRFTVELVYSIFEEIQKKESDFSLRDYAAIKAKVSEKHEKLSKKSRK